jgi:hypothetical protein
MARTRLFVLPSHIRPNTPLASKHLLKMGGRCTKDKDLPELDDLIKRPDEAAAEAFRETPASYVPEYGYDPPKEPTPDPPPVNDEGDTA